jgi:hypothetical protein
MVNKNPYTQFGVVDRNLAVCESGHAFLLKLLDATHPAPPFSEICDVWPVEVMEGCVIFEAKPSARFYNPMGSYTEDGYQQCWIPQWAALSTQCSGPGRPIRLLK